MEMDEVQLEVLNLDGLAMKNQATEQITNIKLNIGDLKVPNFTIFIRGSFILYKKCAESFSSQF